MAKVPSGSPSRGGEVTVYVKDINQPSLPTPFESVLVSISVFVALSTVFHSVNSPTTRRFLALLLESYFCLSTILFFMKVSSRPDLLPSG